MPPLDPRIDFRDDGGTPGWRARHPRVIDAQPRSAIRRFMMRVAGIPLWRIALFYLFWMFVGVPIYGACGIALFAAINPSGSDATMMIVLYGLLGIVMIVESFRKQLRHSRVRY